VNGKALHGPLALVVLFLATTAAAQNRPWCDSGLSRSAPQTSTATELKDKLREATNIPDPMGNRLLPISLSITLSGTVQLNSVHEEHDEDITFCLKLDQQSQQHLQHELGANARGLPTEIHVEIVPYALDRSGNAIFPGWQAGKKDRVLFDGEPIRINTSGWSPLFDNLSGKDKRASMAGISRSQAAWSWTPTRASARVERAPVAARKVVSNCTRWSL